MKKPDDFDYIYNNDNLTHAHSYILPQLLSMLPKSTNLKALRLLDLGCGNGSLSHVISQQGYNVVGIEDSESGVAIAQENFKDCHFIEGSIYNLPYTDLESAFDVVISVEVIEHLLYPRELLKAAQKCLKPNGTLILTTPYHSYPKNLVLALSGKMDKHFTVLWDGGHIKFFSVETLSILLKEAGFTNIKFEFAGRFPYLWKSMLVSCTY